MKAKKLLCLLLAVVFVFGLLPVAALAANFSDTDGHWAEAAIDRWSSYGIVEGNDGSFRPADGMTRAEAAAVFVRLLGLTSTAGAKTFTDVPAGAWYADYVTKASAAGIMVGDTNDSVTTLRPTGVLTREAFFVMFARALGLKEQSTTRGPQADGSSWSTGYINALTDKGYVKGDGSGVNALANINRASVMSLLDQTISTYANAAGASVTAGGSGVTLVAARSVTVSGTAGDLVVAGGAANGTTTIAADASVAALTVTSTAPGATIAVAKDATVASLVSNADNVTVSGEGAVTNATVNANNNKINTIGTTVTIASGATGTTSQGEAISSGDVTKAATTPAGGGAGGAGGASAGSGGSGSNPGSNPGSNTGSDVDTSKKPNGDYLKYINDDSDITNEKMAAYKNVSGSSSDGWTVASLYAETEGGTPTEHDVEITAALKDSSVELKNITFEGNLTVNGGGSESIIMDGVKVKGDIKVTKSVGAMPRIKAESGKLEVTGKVNVIGSKGLRLEVKDDKVPTVTVSSAPLQVGEGATIADLEVSGTASVVAEGNSTKLSNVTVAASSTATITSDGDIGALEAKGNVALSAAKVESVTVPSDGGATKKIDLGSTTVSGTVTVEGANTEIAAEKQLPAVETSATGVTIDAPVEALTVAASSGSETQSTAQTSSVKLTGTVDALTIPSTNTAAAAVTLGDGAEVKAATIKSAQPTAITVPEGAEVTIGPVETTTDLKLTVPANATAAIEKVTVPKGASATVEAPNAKIATVEAKGDTNVTGAAVTNLTVDNGSAVTVSGGSVETATVQNTDPANTSKVAVLKVTGGAKVAEVDAKAATTVTGSGSGSEVANVTANANTVTVNAAVVDKVEAGSSAKTINVANAASGIEVDISKNTASASEPLYIGTVATDSSTGEIKSNETNTSGANAVKVTTSTTNENVMLNGEKPEITKKTPEPVVTYKNSTTLEIKVQKKDGTLTVNDTEVTGTAGNETEAPYTYTVKLTPDSTYLGKSTTVSVTYKYKDETEGTTTTKYDPSNAVSASFTAMSVSPVSIPTGDVRDAAATIDLKDYVTGGTGTFIFEIDAQTGDPTWVALGSSTDNKTNELTYDRSTLTETTRTTSIRIKVKDTGESGTVVETVSVPVGASNLKKSAAPTTASLVKLSDSTTIAKGSGYGSVKVDMTFASDTVGSATSYGTLNVYSDAAKTTLIGTHNVTASNAAGKSATFALTAAPQGDVYVTYTGPYQAPSDATATVNYARLAVTLGAVSSSSSSSVGDVTNQVITLGSSATEGSITPIQATAVGGFEGYTYKITGTGTDKLSVDANGKITGTVAKGAGTITGTLTVTDGTENVTATATFTIRVNDTDVYPTGVTISGPNTLVANSGGIGLSAAVTPAYATTPTIAGWYFVDGTDTDGSPKYVETLNGYTLTPSQDNSTATLTRTATTAVTEATTITIAAKATAKTSAANDAVEVYGTATITIPADRYAISAVTPASLSMTALAGETVTQDFTATTTNNNIVVSGDSITWSVALASGYTSTEFLSQQTVANWMQNGKLTIPAGLDWKGTNETIQLTVTATSSHGTSAAPITRTATVTVTRAEKAAPAAPTGLTTAAPETANGNGKIIGVAVGMEYMNDAGTWTTITSSNLKTGDSGNYVEVPAGTYSVRVKEVAAGDTGAKTPASEAVEVTVPAYTAVLTLTAEPTALSVPSGEPTTGNIATIKSSLKENDKDASTYDLTWTAYFGANKLGTDTTAKGLTFQVYTDVNADTAAENSTGKSAKLTVTKDITGTNGFMNGKTQIAVRITGTYTSGGATQTAVDFIATVSVSVNTTLSEIPKPKALVSATYEVDAASITALDGATTVSDGGTLKYQWYQAEDADGNGGTPIEGATSATYSPLYVAESNTSGVITDTSTSGTYYFYVVVTNEKSGATSASATSNTATITIAGASVEAAAKSEIASALVANDSDWTQDVTVDGKTITVNSMIANQKNATTLLGTAHTAWFGTTYDGGVVLKITAPATAQFVTYGPDGVEATNGGAWKLSEIADGGSGTAADPYYFYHVLCLNKANAAGAETKFSLQWYTSDSAVDDNKIGSTATEYKVINNVTSLDVDTAYGVAHLADKDGASPLYETGTYKYAETANGLTSVTATDGTVYTISGDFTVSGTAMVRHTSTTDSSQANKYFAGMGFYPTGTSASSITKYKLAVTWLNGTTDAKAIATWLAGENGVKKLSSTNAEDLDKNVLETTGENYDGIAAYDNDEIEVINSDVMVLAFQWSDGSSKTTPVEIYIIRFDLAAAQQSYNETEGTYLLYADDDSLLLKVATKGDDSKLTPQDNDLLDLGNSQSSLNVNGATLYVTDAALKLAMAQNYTLTISKGSLFMATQTTDEDGKTTYTGATAATYSSTESNPYYKLENATATMTFGSNKVDLAFTATESGKAATVTTGGSVGLSNGIDSANGISFGNYTVGEKVTLKLGAAASKNAAGGDLWYSDANETYADAQKVSGGYSLYVAGNATFTNNGTIEIPNGAKLVVDNTVTLAGTNGKIEDLGTLEIHAVGVTNTNDGLGYSADLSKLGSAGQTIAIGKASDGNGAISETYFEAAKTAITTNPVIGTQDSVGLKVNQGAQLDLTGATPKLVADEVTINNCRAPFGRGTLKAYDAEITKTLTVVKTAFAGMLTDGYTYNLKLKDGASLYLADSDEATEAVFLKDGATVPSGDNQNYFTMKSVDLTFTITPDSSDPYNTPAAVTYSFAKSGSSDGEVRAVGNSVSNGYIFSSTGANAKWLYTNISLSEGVKLYVDTKLEIAGSKTLSGSVVLNKSDAKMIVDKGSTAPAPASGLAGYTVKTEGTTESDKTVYTLEKGSTDVTYESLQKVIEAAEQGSNATVTVGYTAASGTEGQDGYTAAKYTAKIGDADVTMTALGTAATVKSATLIIDMGSTGAMRTFINGLPNDLAITVQDNGELQFRNNSTVSQAIGKSVAATVKGFTLDSGASATVTLKKGTATVAQNGTQSGGIDVTLTGNATVQKNTSTTLGAHQYEVYESLTVNGTLTLGAADNGTSYLTYNDDGAQKSNYTLYVSQHGEGQGVYNVNSLSLGDSAKIVVPTGARLVVDDIVTKSFGTGASIDVTGGVLDFHKTKAPTATSDTARAAEVAAVLPTSGTVNLTAGGEIDFSFYYGSANQIWPVFFGSTATVSDPAQGTKLTAGTVTLNLTTGSRTVTFNGASGDVAAATANVYQWNADFSAIIAEGASVTVGDSGSAITAGTYTWDGSTFTNGASGGGSGSGSNPSSGGSGGAGSGSGSGGAAG